VFRGSPDDIQDVLFHIGGVFMSSNDTSCIVSSCIEVFLRPLQPIRAFVLVIISILWSLSLLHGCPVKKCGVFLFPCVIESFPC